MLIKAARALGVLAVVAAIILACTQTPGLAPTIAQADPPPPSTTVVTPTPITVFPEPITVTYPPPETVTETTTAPPVTETTTVTQPPVTSTVTSTQTTTVTAPPVTSTVTVTPTTTSTTPTTTTTTTTTTPPAGTRLFTGDYAPGTFCQWVLIQARNYNGSACSYPQTYSASIVNDAVKTKAARFEVRSGDVPPFGGGERSEVSAGSSSTTTSGTEGQIRWYAFSTKFDANFPMNHKDLGWGVTNQWHAPSDCCSPPVEWNVNTANGSWSLVLNKQSSPGNFVSIPEVYRTPLDRGNWHDIKMEVKWSTSDTVGYIRVWQNGVPQTLTNGSTTFFGRTLTPGDSNGGYYKEGYYRKAMSPTGIVFHAGFRAATTEAALG